MYVCTFCGILILYASLLIRISDKFLNKIGIICMLGGYGED